MSTTVSAFRKYQIAERARVYLRDRPRRFSERYVTTGNPLSYELPMGNIVPESVTVSIGVDPTQSLSETADFTVDTTAGRLSLVSTWAADLDMWVEGQFWEWFSDRDLSDYTDIVIDNYARSEGDNLSDLVEDAAVRNCMAAAVLVEGLWALLTEVARDIDVRTPEGDIPATQRYRQLLGLLEFWKEELGRMEQALNIGLYRLEMFNLRRISLRTGRLVPLYVAQEYDDTDPPVRVQPRIDPGGPVVVVDDGEEELPVGSEYLLNMTRGLPFGLIVTYKDNDVPVDMSDPAWTVRLVIKEERLSTAPVIAEFTETDSKIVLGADGTVTVDLSGTDTEFPVRGYEYDLAVYDPLGVPVVLLSGPMYVEATTL